jgi:hypothetical protein
VIHSIIVPAENPNMSAHTHTEIYGGSAGCNIVINGVTVSIGQSTNVAVQEVLWWNWMLPLGENKDVFNGTNRNG